MRQAIRLLIAGMLAGAVQAAEPVLTAEQLQQDLEFMRRTITEIHPDPGVSIAPARLEAALDAAQRQLSAPMERDAAWRVLAKLNPQFADAHLALLQPQRDKQVQAHLAAGGAFFPYEVRVSPEGQLFIRAELGGKASRLSGKRIEGIDGVPASQLVQELLQLVHGDTAAFRTEVLSRRFWFYYWKTYGAPAAYTCGRRACSPTSPPVPTGMPRPTSRR